MSYIYIHQIDLFHTTCTCSMGICVASLLPACIGKCWFLVHSSGHACMLRENLFTEMGRHTGISIIWWILFLYVLQVSLKFMLKYYEFLLCIHFEKNYWEYCMSYLLSVIHVIVIYMNLNNVYDCTCFNVFMREFYWNQ